MKPATTPTRRVRVHLRMDADLKRDIHLHAVRTGTTITQLTLDYYRDTLKQASGPR